MGTIHALQRRVEVAQQGLALFDEETRGTGARLSDAFGRIEDVLREKDFQLVRRELEVQRLTRENAQARMLLETLLETVEQRKLTSLREVIEQFERKLAASAAVNGKAEPAADAGSDATAGEGAEAAPDPAPAQPEAEPEPAQADVEPAGIGLTLAELMAGEPVQPTPSPTPVPSAPVAAFADPASDVTVAVPLAAPEPSVEPAAEEAVEEPEAEVLPPAAVARVVPVLDANEELIADARAQLRSRKGGARLMEEEQRRYAYKVWLGPILIGIGALGPLALVLARISH
jgi:hypothetical protein